MVLCLSCHICGRDTMHWLSLRNIFKLMKSKSFNLVCCVSNLAFHPLLTSFATLDKVRIIDCTIWNLLPMIQKDVTPLILLEKLEEKLKLTFFIAWLYRPNIRLCSLWFYSLGSQSNHGRVTVNNIHYAPIAPCFYCLIYFLPKCCRLDLWPLITPVSLLWQGPPKEKDCHYRRWLDGGIISGALY